MLNLKPYAFLVAAIYFALPATGFSLGPVRCNGIVQFRPCGQSFSFKQEQSRTSSIDAHVTETAPRTRVALLQRTFPAELEVTTTPQNSSRYARITSQSFQQVSIREGQWNGIVEGDGKVQLALQWYRQGTLYDTRPMGSIILARKATSFGFKSSIPTGSGWTWRVHAFATEPT